LTDEILRRIDAALDALENVEHRVATIIEGNRMQLSNLAEHLKIRQLRAELRDIAVAIRESP
jgi:transcription elongation GreA/GreB family factor